MFESLHSFIFHYVMQSLNGLFTKSRFGKIAPSPDHFDNCHSINIYVTNMEFGTYKLDTVLQVMTFLHTNKVMWFRCDISKLTCVTNY